MKQLKIATYWNSESDQCSLTPWWHLSNVRTSSTLLQPQRITYHGLTLRTFLYEELDGGCHFFCKMDATFGWPLIRDECNDHNVKMTMIWVKFAFAFRHQKWRLKQIDFWNWSWNYCLKKWIKHEIKVRWFWNLKSEIKFRNKSTKFDVY